MSTPISRRDMLRTAAVAAGVWTTYGRLSFAQTKSPNEKLNIAAIGVGGRGGDDVNGVAHENLVALCDVDEARAGATFEKFPQAKRFKDFRRMLDEIHAQIDAVVIGSPDHTHAPAGVMAMRMGKHCYCEKPLTHSVYEARTMATLAREHKLVTQMGTQIHEGKNYRRTVELVQSGAVGSVSEVHVWLGADFNGPAQPTDMTQPDAPKDQPPVPPTLDWDLWLGPAAYRPYHTAYAPFSWRYWWNFANGQLGDFFCHYCDLAFWALKLRHPTTIEARARASGKHRAVDNRTARVSGAWRHAARDSELVQRRSVSGTGEGASSPAMGQRVLFVGSTGMLIADYGNHQLLPEAQYKDFKRPDPFIPDSIGHHREWTEACKTGGPTTCNFDYSGALTEAALLCNVALRTGTKLVWDAGKLAATNCPEAAAFIRREYRDGWTL